MTLEEAMENRDRLYKEYLLAVRKGIAKVLRLHHYKFPHSYGDSDAMRKATYETTDQILKLLKGEK